MAGRAVPETANRPDWPRLVAQAIKDHEQRLADLELPALGDHVDDAAAAAAGVAVGKHYRTGSIIKIRVS